MNPSHGWLEHEEETHSFQLINGQAAEFEDDPPLLARVIVDVPSKQTNRPFDYVVPEQLRAWVVIGSRVGVPFGPRTVQGFVIGFVSVTDVPIAKLKPIQQLLDLVPPLPPDLVMLAEWMSNRYVCTHTAALQVMLPGALKGKSEKAICIADDGVNNEPDLVSWMNKHMLDEPLVRQLLQYVKEHQPIPADKLLSAFPHAVRVLKVALQSGWLLETEHIKDRIGIKKLKRVTLLLDPEEAEQYAHSLKAKRQQ